jgi:hypothetical protein
VFGRVRSIIDPQLQAAADIINRRSGMGSQAISSATNTLSGLAGAYSRDVQKAYGPEIGLWRGLADWSQKQLAQSGAARQADLGAALAQSGVQGPGDINLAQQGQGAGLAAYGTGIAQLDQYIASQAASQARAALEPSFAAGMGAQQQSVLAAQLARQLGEQQSQIQAQVPDLVARLQEQDYARQQDERDYQLRTAQLGLEQGRWATEQQTGQQRWEAEQKRAQAEQSLAEREFGLRKTTAASELAARRAGLVGPRAPTVQGRTAYWQDLAEKRTATTGEEWVGTARGMHPSGRLTSRERESRIGQILATGYNPKTQTLTPQAQQALKRYGYGGGISEGLIKSQVSAKAGLQKAKLTAQTQLKKEKVRHQETLQRLQIAQQNANTAVARAGISQATAAEHARHNRWVEQHPGSASTKIDKPLGTPTGNRPRRTKSGTWTYADGRKLPANAAAIWERYYQSGRTDGRGGLGPAKRKGTSSDLPRGVQ